MSTQTMERPVSVMFAGERGMGAESIRTSTFAKDDGTQVLLMEDVPVFRSGSFRNSWGELTTWDDLHIQQIVANFNMLKDSGIFADVPTRDGHPGFMYSGGSSGEGRVIGYHTGLRAEKRMGLNGQEYTYLLASYEILDPAAQQSIKSGLWRNRSAEIGAFVTNDEAEYWPTYMGVAYVDIPAVQGLNAFSQQSKHKFSFINEEDPSMSTPEKAEAVTPVAPAPPAPPVAPVVAATEPAAAEVESAPVAVTTTEPVSETVPVKVEQPEPVVAEEEQPAEGEFKAGGAPQMFTIGGRQTSNYSEVQAHIASLEAFQSETVNAGREDFVKALVAGGQLLAMQQDGMVAFAKGLNAEQFSAWKSTMEAAPKNPVLATYGAHSPDDASGGAEDREAATLRDTIAYHKQAGKSNEMIEAMDSYKRLKQLDPTFNL